ncbi:MAG: hypothetical protein AAF823_09640 [Planctomycetota bacterium]
MSGDGLFGEGATTQAADAALVEAYRRADRTLDDLPYTEAFVSLYGEVREALGGASRAEVFHRLHNLRKAGKLPRLGRASSSPPRLDETHEALIVELVEREVGRLSLRDRLIYEPGFDAIVEAFNAETGLGLTHHDAWRVIAKLAK